MKSNHRNRRQGGFMLLEALVAIVIFSIGVLGLVGLQASMTKAQTGSKYRADAALLAQRLIGNMWVDRSGLGNYDTDSGCGGHARCSQWLAEVASTLPAGSATVDVTALPDGMSAGQVVAAEVAVTITWTPPNEEQHRFTTISAVAPNP